MKPIVEFKTYAYVDHFTISPRWGVIPTDLSGVTKSFARGDVPQYGFSDLSMITDPSEIAGKSVNKDTYLMLRYILVNTFVTAFITFFIVTGVHHLGQGGYVELISGIVVYIATLYYFAVVVSEINEKYIKRERACGRIEGYFYKSLKRAGRKNGNKNMYFGYSVENIYTYNLGSAMRHCIKSYIDNRSNNSSQTPWNETPMFKALMEVKEYSDYVGHGERAESIKNTKEHEDRIKSLIDTVFLSIEEYEESMSVVTVEP